MKTVAVCVAVAGSVMAERDVRAEAAEAILVEVASQEFEESGVSNDARRLDSKLK